VRRWSSPILGGALTSWVAGLLAGLILTVHLGAPLVGRGMLRAIALIGPRGADPGDADPDADAKSAGDEAPASEVNPFLFARGRSPRLSHPRGERPLGILPAWAVRAASCARREWLARRARSGDPMGHFLAPGRSFRTWIQSLTC
jgi:hypothetical protein